MINFINKNTLSEVDLYQGTINMPEGFEINREKIAHSIVTSEVFKKSFLFTKEWDKLNTYVRDFIGVRYNKKLVNKDQWGNIYYPNQTSDPLLQIDPVDLRHSPDYVMLYGVKTTNCTVRIFYDNNRRKGRSLDVLLKDNEFVIFPSTNLYAVKNTQSDSFNFIQTITYEYM